MDAGALYRQLAPAVRGYLRAQGVPDPDDVLSEVFLHVARSLPRYKGDEDGVRPWVFAIARHRALDAHRRRARRPQTSDAAVPEVAVTDRPGAMDPELVVALAQLTAEQREVVVLRFVADLSLEAVAEITGRPVGAVKSMQHRALGQLARILGAHGGAVLDDG